MPTAILHVICLLMLHRLSACATHPCSAVEQHTQKQSAKNHRCSQVSTWLEVHYQAEQPVRTRTNAPPPVTCAVLALCCPGHLCAAARPTHLKKCSTAGGPCCPSLLGLTKCAGHPKKVPGKTRTASPTSRPPVTGTQHPQQQAAPIRTLLTHTPRCAWLVCKHP
jgi:hypothetical protein